MKSLQLMTLRDKKNLDNLRTVTCKKIKRYMKYKGMKKYYTEF